MDEWGEMCTGWALAGFYYFVFGIILMNWEGCGQAGYNESVICTIWTNGVKCIQVGFI